MVGDIELRKIPLGDLSDLIDILEVDQDWEKIMAKVPAELDSTIDEPKYTSEHIKRIKTHCNKIGKRCAEVFLDEWGTSGKLRPTLRTLQQLALQAEIYRAAVKIAKMLQEPEPERPSKGPAAAVDTDINKLLDFGDIEVQLEDIATVNTLDQISNGDTFDNNIDKAKCYDHVKSKNFIEKFVKSPDSCTTLQMKSDSNMIKLSKPNETSNTNNLDVNKGDAKSDMIQFSKTSTEIPAFSQLMREDKVKESVTNFELPANLDVKKEGSITNMIQFSKTHAEIPALSQLMRDDKVHEDMELPAFSKLESNSTSTINDTMTSESQELSVSKSNFPNIGEIDLGQNKPLNQLFNQDYSKNPTALKLFTNTNSLNLPNISVFLNDKDTKNSFIDTEILRNSKLIPFAFEELMMITKNFNSTCDLTKNIPGKIGEGGFGEVFVGVHEKFGAIAIKKAFEQPNESIRQKFLQQFNAEVITLSNFRHVNILPILGYSIDGPSPCIVCEYIGGGSLRQKLDEKVLNKDERTNIILGTITGLMYLHCGTTRRMIHRDVKSANILLTDQLTVKLCDFGLARQSQDTTSTTSPIGTSAYMAPEAFHGDVSLKMDVYSFGIVLLEMLTGLKPILKISPVLQTNIKTFIEENCDDDITPLLDSVIGDWPEAQAIYSLAQNCLKEKRYRFTIEEVHDKYYDVIFKKYNF